MRWIALVCLASPATAWEFSASPVCTLSHVGAEAEVTLTFDPAGPEYAITITRRDAPWPDAAVFGITFRGMAGLSIGTDRHVLSDGGASLTVTDSGFGNVLDGLQYNTVALAQSGEAVVQIDLREAAAPVAAFRRCPEPGLS